MSNNIEILVGPKNREKFLNKLFYQEGLFNKIFLKQVNLSIEEIVENPKKAYCPISLTATPRILEEFLRMRQQITLDVLRELNIDAYDPYSAPFSPDKNIRLHTSRNIPTGFIKNCFG